MERSHTYCAVGEDVCPIATWLNSVGFYGAKLVLAIPTYTRGKKQYNSVLKKLNDWNDFQGTYSCRTCDRTVEKKYTILEGPLPVNLIKHSPMECRQDSHGVCCPNQLMWLCCVIVHIYRECHSVLQAHYHSHQCCTYYVTYCFGHMYMCWTKTNHLQLGQYHFPLGFLVMPTHLYWNHSTLQCGLSHAIIRPCMFLFTV